MVAAALVKSGTDAAEINRLLFDAKSRERLLAEQVALENLRLDESGRIAYVALSYEEAVARGIDMEELDALVDTARSVEGISIAFAVKQREPSDEYRISMRSLGKVDVSLICEELGGGGHQKAAACTLTADSAEDAAELVLERLKNYI